MSAKDEVVLTLTEDLDSDVSAVLGPFNPTSRFIALFGHFAFRTAALLTYLFCSWFTSSFITPFVIIILCLSLDFWFVKNISGRILAGLRWSVYTDKNGDTQWKFDSRSPQSNVDPNSLTRREVTALAYQANQNRLFWIGLVGTPVLWCVFLLASIFSLHFRWALVATISGGMSAANLYGFLRCRMTNATAPVSAFLNNFKFNVVRNVISQAWSQSGSTVQPGSRPMGSGGTLSA